MTTSSSSPHTLYGVPPGHAQSVRYRVPAGLAQEVLREAQRRNVSASSVVAAILAQGLSTFTAAGVTDRLEHAVRTSVQAQTCPACGASASGATSETEVRHD